MKSLACLVAVVSPTLMTVLIAKLPTLLYNTNTKIQSNKYINNTKHKYEYTLIVTQQHKTKTSGIDVFNDNC